MNVVGIKIVVSSKKKNSTQKIIKKKKKKKEDTIGASYRKYVKTLLTPDKFRLKLRINFHSILLFFVLTTFSKTYLCTI